MAVGSQKRTRSERVAALEMPPGPGGRLLALLRRRTVLIRVLAAFGVSVVLCLLVRGWDPPFAIRTGYVPDSDIVATASFSRPDAGATEDARDLARSRVRCVFVQNPEPLVQLRALLRSRVAELTAAAKLSDVNPRQWADFQLAAEDDTALTKAQREEAFTAFRQALLGDENLGKFEKNLAVALAPFERRGLLSKFPREPGKGSFEEIYFYPMGHQEAIEKVKLSEVLIGDGKAIHQSLQKHLDNSDVADRVFAWLRQRLRDTLTLDEVETKRALDAAAAAVGQVLVKVEAGNTLARAGQALDRRQVTVLQLEHEAATAQRSWPERVAHGAAMVITIFSMFLLCGAYMRYRQQIFPTVRQWTALLLLAGGTAAVAHFAAADTWRVELIPLLLFAMSAAIAFGQELALVLAGILAAIVALTTGQGLPGFLLLGGVSVAAILQLGQIRSRPKLIYVGLLSAAVAVVLSLVTSILDNQPLDLATLTNGARNGLWTIIAALLMSGLLPFIEHWFGVLTDLRLLDLGDVAHPLLQELIRRAPATYNHSITVGSIAEAAADAIGARGLLVRVGAYFHDIGKMLKPSYFIENQGKEANLHETLLPAMSTLVIIAHVKDGADLGRQRRLPPPIIDIIEQHHGTTLVEFFYGRAHEQAEQDPNGAEIDESTYRYPGPKPQTKEAGVLMLADAVEGACRALVEPTPARIESLVCEVAERRLQDGQFDESGLTLSELRTVERSLIKSLTALYHGRIKYPDQRNAS